MNSIDTSLKLLEKLILKEKPLRGKKKRHPATDKRDTKCLKNPERTHEDQDEWFIYVPSCFNDCLDIRKTDRVVKTGRLVLDETTQKMKPETRTQKVWTQGSRFAFHRGCTLYDTPKAYHRWADAINQIKYCVSIHSATSAEPAKNEKHRIAGIVEFSILSPSTRTMTLKEIGAYTRTQDEFISFLINGDPEIISR